MNKKFKAFLVNNNHKNQIKEISKNELMDGDVFIKNEFSSFNFKDGLAITGKLPIIKNFPMIPGVDFSGIVLESNHSNFKKNDDVILNGWGVGEKHYGGFSQFSRVSGDWLIKKPKSFNYEQSMIIGSAGYTAALCVLRIKDQVKNKKNDKILVTGASGGVGSVAVHLLANLGYNVTGLSGKNKNFLLDIGAKEVISREEFSITDKPLMSEKWTACIDTVGGDILSSILTQIKYDGIVASTGLAKSPKLSTTVFPFILRNITLAGVDCVYAPYAKRVNAWQFLEKYLDINFLEIIQTTKSLQDLPSLSKDIINGNLKGRTVIDVNN